MAFVLQRAFIAEFKSNNRYRPDDVFTAYKAVGISYPGTAFEFIKLLFAGYHDKDLNKAIYDLRGQTKKQGDTVRHNNWDRINKIHEIVKNYNTVVDSIARLADLPAVKAYRVNSQPSGSRDGIINNRNQRTMVCRCPNCGKNFNSEQALENHIRDVHVKGSANKNVQYNQDFTGKHVEIKKPTKKPSKFKMRFFVSLAIATAVFIATIITLIVSYNLPFLTSLWISAIVLYAFWAIAYDFFADNFIFRFVLWLYKKTAALFKSVHEDYDVNGFFKFLEYFGLCTFYIPIAFTLIIVFGCTVSIVLFIPALIVNFVKRND